MMKKILSKSVLATAIACLTLAACGDEPRPGGSSGHPDCTLPLPTNMLARDVQGYVDLALRADGCQLGDSTLRAELLRIDSGSDPAPYLRAVLRVVSADAEIQPTAQ